MKAMLMSVALAIGTPATAQQIAPEAAFGAREAVGSASLSPDGDRIAFLAPGKGQGDALFTAPVDGSSPPRPALRTDGDPERIRSCGWVSNARLVCSVSAKRAVIGRVYTATRLIAVNSDGSDQKLLSRRIDPNARYFNLSGGGVVDWLPGEDGAVLMTRSYVPAERIGSLITQDKEGAGVDRVDTVSLVAKRVVAPNPAAADYISDGIGNVRIMGNNAFKGDGFTTGVFRYYYRLQGKTDWLPLGNYDIYSREGFAPYAVDPTENAVYGLKKKDGRLALYKRALDGSLREELVYARPDVDVDDIVRIGRRNRIVGLSFATDRRQAYFFDPTLAAISKALGRALPGNSAINFEGASADEQKLLIWVGSDVDPGCHYLFDRKTKQLKRLLLSRPELAGYTLAPVKSVKVRAADGTQIPAYLTLPPGSDGKHLPAIVMPHGGPASRDEWGFDWLAQYFANRGYAVIQPNFRGSTGYGDAWYEKNGFRSWRIAIGDVDDAGRWLVSEGIADPAKLAIVGWSYGGYAALQSGVLAPDLFKAIVAIAPVTDLGDLKEQYRDTSSYNEVSTMIGDGPQLREGSPAQNAAAIRAPVLMFHGDLDANVRIQASKLMADKLRGAGKSPRLVIYPGSDHQIDDAANRADMLGKSDAFLRQSMKL